MGYSEDTLRTMADSIDKMVSQEFAGVKYHHQWLGFDVLELNVDDLEKIGQLESVQETLQKFGWWSPTWNSKVVTYVTTGNWKNPYK